MKFRPPVIVFIIALTVTSLAQEPQNQRPAVTIRVETDLVVVDVIASDKHGNYIRDLRADDVEVFEDGRPRKIDFFTRNDEPALTRPLAVVFALDLSGSLKPEETMMLRDAAMKFTELMKGESVFAALGFNNNVKVIQNFTRNGRDLEKAISRVNRFEGSTRIYDAIDKSITMLDRKAPRSSKGREMRRVVIVISDGFDSASTIDRREMVRRANAAGVTVYSITLPSYVLSPTHSGERVITPLDATRVVATTGGRDFEANVTDFTPVFRALAEEIQSSYSVAYYPDLRDGKYHEVRIRISRPDVRVRVNRTGYIAPVK